VPALAQRIRHDQQHGRAGDDEQDGGGGDEGEPEGERHGAMKPDEEKRVISLSRKQTKLTIESTTLL
jgi:hypothetical protein